MNTELLDIADMNASAVAYYYYGDTSKAMRGVVGTLSMLTNVNKSKQVRLQQLYWKRSTAKKLVLSTPTNQELTSCHNQSHDQQHWGSSSKPEVDAVYDQDDIDDEHMDMYDDMWTYAAANYYAGRTKDEYLVTEYSVQPRSAISEPTGSARMPADSTVCNNRNCLNEDVAMDSCVGMYKGAFLLSNDIPCACKETAAVLSYNLALMNHCEAVQAGRSSTSLLWKPLQLYQQALYLLGQEDINFIYILSGAHPPSVVDKTDITAGFWYQRSVMLATVAAAIYCNIADIYCRFQAEAIKKIPILDQLSAIIRYLDTETGTTNTDLRTFHITHSFLVASLKHPSPAA